jgi:hypothetical protein
MKTKEGKNLLSVGVVLIVCLIALGFSASIRGSEVSYKVEPEITLPESRTDAARAIDAYERVMDRFMDLNEKNLTGISGEVKDISRRLISIDYKLTELSERLARIEKALEIEQCSKPVEKCSKTETKLQSNESGTEVKE